MSWSRPGTATSFVSPADVPQLPHIKDDDSFAVLLCKLESYITEAVRVPQTYDELRITGHHKTISPLIWYLSEDVSHRAIVCALLALKGHFDVLDPDDDGGINDSRSAACEYVAWRFVSSLSGRDAIDYLLTELPPAFIGGRRFADEESESGTSAGSHPGRLPFEGTPLLRDTPQNDGTGDPLVERDDFGASFENLHALEIAAVVRAKKFLSQKVVQRIVESIWRGDIVFWETLSVESTKEAKVYNKRKADPFCRLRVPQYLKAFQCIFFISFLALYYAVLVPIQRTSGSPGLAPHAMRSITPAEIFLYVWVASFAYDEFGEYIDAGQAFYATDFWSLWDIAIVVIGVAFLVTRSIGIANGSDQLIETAFDILALEALFLVPRICSTLLSLNPYFGTLIPCLREMTKDFVKFLILVIILYLGFLTTFTLLARDNFTLEQMSWVLVRVFFGSSSLGFDVARQISPFLGPLLMLIFVCMTNVLLITSLISLLSNSLTRVLDQGREEYLYNYSVYVLEASMSKKLTYYLPPLNLIPLLLRPLRLVVSTETLRSARIVLLKLTHAPHVAAIFAFEAVLDWVQARRSMRSSSLSGPMSGTNASLKRPLARAPAAASGPGFSPEFRGTRSATSAAPPHSTPDDLRPLVLRLSEQVEELQAAVASLGPGKVKL
ncbi:hypothetical protein EJ06DRAFT_533983 [Trichodelitschia bisporula]|uniref:Calcium channel YVC1-like C-terminal transmembrane domain-containing protein n=1 Tax=Trichodelitschia bisporula TaxID=703511 RepID=A0A6G1HL55_9PEZI|nr:hypothetical protein EJ06DRAFT_533983 [Trichodelitschia bisporula]